MDYISGYLNYLISAQITPTLNPHHQLRTLQPIEVTAGSCIEDAEVLTVVEGLGVVETVVPPEPVMELDTGSEL